MSGQLRSRVLEKMALQNGVRQTMYYPKAEGEEGKEKYGVQYTGEWKEGKKDGYGVMICNAQKYKGEWKEDERHGKGTLWRMEDGKWKIRYMGMWKEGKRHGHGTFYYADGSSYSGNWCDNVREGEGVMKHASSAMYDGDWRRNKRSGRGVCVLENGDRYEGDWVDDDRHGMGKYYFKSSGKVFEGQYIHGVPQTGEYRCMIEEKV